MQNWKKIWPCPPLRQFKTVKKLLELTDHQLVKYLYRNMLYRSYHEYLISHSQHDTLLKRVLDFIARHPSKFDKIKADYRRNLK